MNPNLRPEKQHAMPKQGISEKPWAGQGRAGLRRRRPDHINQPSDVTQGIPRGSKIETGKTNSSQGTNSVHDRAINNNNPFMPDVPLHPDPLCKPSSLQQNTNKINQKLILIYILRKTHHFRKASYPKQFKDWTNHFFKIWRHLKIL